MWSRIEEPEKLNFAQPTSHISKNNRNTDRSTRTSNMVVKSKHLLSNLALKMHAYAVPLLTAHAQL